MERSTYMKEEKLHSAFALLDLDGNGRISKDELKTVLGKDQDMSKKDDSYWENMIKEVDKNGDGEIDYSEFIDMMSSIQSKKK